MTDIPRCWRAWIGPVVVLVLALTSAVGCQGDPAAGEQPEIGVEVQVQPEPPRVGPATVVVTLTDAGGGPVRGASVQVEGNMNHAGMKPEFGDGRESKPGRYEAPLEFTMGGDWFLLVDVHLDDGRTLREQVDVPAVRTR